MDSLLSLDNIRGTLARLEESIIFGLLERAQFCHNPVIYQPDGVGALGGESLVGFLLHESERAHAKVRRYTSPDEQPFFDDLPAPILPLLAFDNPLYPNRISLNPDVRAAYEQEIVPFFCAPGDDRQWGSSAVSDVLLLQVISKRVHYGKFVAESKFRARTATFAALIQGRDAEGLQAAVTDSRVEEQVLERVYRKAATYGREVGAGANRSDVTADNVRTIYSRWIIPLNKRVQVIYLLGRPLG